MKTNPTEGYTAHTNWLQIVSDGSNELFRIYWTFSVARTLSDRFVSAVNGNGEAVSYRVVDTANVAGNGAGYEFTYTGASWRFSDGAIMTATKFTTIGTTYGFSADDGCWGAGTGTLNANLASALPNFWGIANINSADSLCSNIYVQGSVYAVNANVRSFIYIVPSGTSRPSKAPTARPSTTPTASPTLPNGPFELFAVVGSGACAENLAYGPATLTEAGSSDGNSMYFSTSTTSGQQPHTDWLQIVTTESSGELFRIYWTFSTAKTLADRFVNAPTNGEWVSYRVVDTAGVAGPAGTVYVYSGTWRFSDTAAITASQFTNTYTTWTGFSSDDGAWGAAPSYINANNYPTIPNFWGVGNLDNSDSGSCNNVYANGEVKYTTSKAFMYISTPSVTTSRAPTRSPAAVPGSTSTMSSKVVAFFSPVVITAIIVVVVALALLGLLSYCYRQYLCRCGQSPSTNGEGPAAAVVVVVGAYDLGDVEVQVVSGGEDGGAGSIEMMKMSFEQGGQDPSAPPMYVPEADMVAAAAASAPPAAYFTESAVAVPTAAVNYYATTTAHCDV